MADTKADSNPESSAPEAAPGEAAATESQAPAAGEAPKKRGRKKKEATAAVPEHRMTLRKREAPKPKEPEVKPSE